MIPLLQATESAVFTSTASGIATYVPYIQGVCYAIAACVCVVTALVIFDDIQNERSNLQGKLIGCIGSITFFISAAIFIPDVFGVSDNTSGSLALDYKYGVTGKSSDGLLTSERGGVPSTGLIVEIPDINSNVWINLHDKYGRLPYSNATVDDFYLYSDYVSSSKGDLGLTQKRIINDYLAGKMDFRTYVALYWFAEANGHTSSKWTGM